MSNSNSAQHTPGRVTYAQIRDEAGVGPVCPRWSRILELIEEKAETGAHYRELMAEYTAHREPIEREAFKARVRSGGMRHVGNSGRV
jgi:hypothetical protein